MVSFCEKKYPLYSRDENIFPQPVDKIAENAPIYNREANRAGAVPANNPPRLLRRRPVHDLRGDRHTLFFFRGEILHEGCNTKPL